MGKKQENRQVLEMENEILEIIIRNNTEDDNKNEAKNNESKGLSDTKDSQVEQ